MNAFKATGLRKPNFAALIGLSLLLVACLPEQAPAPPITESAPPARPDRPRRNFVRWLFEDEPRGSILTPTRWRRDYLRRDGAYR